MLGIATAILLIPVIGMAVSTEVAWTGLDFLAAALLLYSAVIIIEFILRNVKNKGVRLALCLAILFLMLLLWFEMAVGIFDSPIAGR